MSPANPELAGAIRLMCAGAAAELAVLITIIATAGSVRSAVARRHPGLPAAQHAVNVNLVIDYISASLGIAMWLVLIWALVRGRGAGPSGPCSRP